MPTINHTSPFAVAVVVPTFNRARLIGEALDSILTQQPALAGRIEVAIVDDGSTDDTASVVAPYLQCHGAETDSEVVIRYTRLEKQGVVTARNTAIAATTAPLVAFLDSDDFWTPGKLAGQVAILDAQPKVGVVHTAYRYVDEAGHLADGETQRPNNPCVGRCVATLLREDLVIFPVC